MSRRSPEQRATSAQSLLKSLATGGREPLLELDDWEDHLAQRPSLRSTPVGRWFLSALRCEWRAPEPPTALCAALTEDVESYMETRPGPWAMVLGHILRVTGNAVWLAEGSNIDPEAAYLAGLFHDVGKLDEWDTNRPHAQLGAKRASRTLAGELPRSTVEAIREAIAMHPDRPAPSWDIARVLHDADKLDKVGATGLIRRVSKTDNLEDACREAERTLDEADSFPVPCLGASNGLLERKLAFARTLERLLDDACPDAEF